VSGTTADTDPIATAREATEILAAGFVARVDHYVDDKKWGRGAVAKTEDGAGFYVVIRGVRCRVAVAPEP
jgi:hypothetical protein